MISSNWMAPGKNHVTVIVTEVFKYVRIHPNFASRPVWCEKMFLCCFSLKAGRKDLTNRPKVLSPHPTVFCRVARGFSHLMYPNSAFFQEEKSNWGGGGGGGGGWKRTSGLFVKSFLPAFTKKTTQEHLFKSHRSARQVWVDSDILENFSRNGGYVVLAWSHSIILCCDCMNMSVNAPRYIMLFILSPSSDILRLW